MRSRDQKMNLKFSPKMLELNKKKKKKEIEKQNPKVVGTRVDELNTKIKITY